jgi:hypothetical protein
MIGVEQVEGRRGTARFIDAAWAVQGETRSKTWVPPLRSVVRGLLDQRRNPFWAGAARALFIARHRGRVVGRIAAIENGWHNRHHGDRVGFFGFFECVDDPAAAGALLGEAEGWLRARGLTSTRGPVSPSMNHECGLLVGGFEHPPVLMTPWNPPYYAALLEGSGYQRAHDLLGYWIPSGDRLAVPERVARLADRTRDRSGITFRTLDLALFDREVRRVHDLYCDAWTGNWGFVPPSLEEFLHSAKKLRPLIAEDFSFVAEVEDEIVGFMLIARDLNHLLPRIRDGRLWPWNVARLVTGLPRVLRGRIVLLGLKADSRKRGLFPLFAHEAARRALHIGADGAEASWVLADNQALVAPLEAMGIEPYRSWRLYEKPLGPG